MALNIKAGDIVRADQTYIRGVFANITSQGPTHLQTLQSLYLLRDETAEVLSIGHVTIKDASYTSIHITPVNKANTLLRGGKGTNIYFICEDYVNNSLLKV